ncbi:cytochrome c [Rhodobacter calidifons]|uniref:Cytochrome c n=1 Tax=Rhodobacter calidifons TaxID=2715277 RepID=A0ABX0GB18_9RHOB|nr:c-type cytochrome [Rhodobacter calidifons]NHB78489.1 cytochrome c [Rhodobacter calidifons]
MRLVLLMVMAALGLAGCVEKERAPTGAEDYASYCAACHGAGGKGDGPAAAGLDRRPADLTRLSARNGGAFPGTRVMAKIWGYTGGRSGASPMPAFGPLLQGDLVPYDGGDGIASPTPVRLVQIAEFVKGLQE